MNSLQSIYIPPYPHHCTLIAKREEIILTAIRSGKDYDTALGYAEQHIPIEQVDRARDDYQAQCERFKRANKSDLTAPSWISNLVGGIFK